MTPDQWRESGDWQELCGPRIFCRHSGGSLPALVLQHGYSTSSWDWYPLLSVLESSFRVITFDFAGFGFSSRSVRHRYSIREQADVAEQLLQRLEIRGTHVLAHDYRDTVGQELLVPGSRRERSSSCSSQYVFLNDGLFPESHRPRPIQKLLLSPLGGIAVRLITEQRFTQSLFAVLGPQTQPAEDELEMFRDVASGYGGHRLLHDMPERRQYRDRWVEVLNDSGVPMRVICGMRDPASDAHTVERYRELVCAPDVVESNESGHYPQVEAPQSVLDAFPEFYQRL